MRKITTIVFDLGGVLIDWNPKNVFDQVFASEKEVDYFLTEVCSGSWNAEQDRGRTFQEGIELKIKEFPELKSEITLYFDRWEEMISGPIAETVEILKLLHQQGKVRLYALTNWSAETFPYAWKTFEFLKIFEGILVSGKEKLIKPDPAIYKLLIHRYDIVAEEAIFIDDSAKNVEAANKIGMVGILYKSSSDLYKKLTELEVLPKV